MNLLSERNHGNKKVVWCADLYTAVPVVEDVDGRWAMCPPVARASTQLLLLMTQDLKHINARIHEEVEFLREANKGGWAAKAVNLTGSRVSRHNKSYSLCRSVPCHCTEQICLLYGKGIHRHDFLHTHSTCLVTH